MTYMYTLKTIPTKFDAFLVKNFWAGFFGWPKIMGSLGGPKKKNPLKKIYTGVRGSRNVDPKPQKTPAGVF